MIQILAKRKFQFNLPWIQCYVSLVLGHQKLARRRTLDNNLQNYVINKAIAILVNISIILVKWMQRESRVTDNQVHRLQFPKCHLACRRQLETSKNRSITKQIKNQEGIRVATSSGNNPKCRKLQKWRFGSYQGRRSRITTRRHFMPYF